MHSRKRRLSSTVRTRTPSPSPQSRPVQFSRRTLLMNDASISSLIMPPPRPVRPLATGSRGPSQRTIDTNENAATISSLPLPTPDMPVVSIVERVPSAYPIVQSPGGSSLFIQEPSVPLVRTPGGTIHSDTILMSVLLRNTTEIEEALDMSDEDADDLAEHEPGHVERWLDESFLAQEFPSTPHCMSETSTHDPIENVEEHLNIPSASSVEADVRPSTSGTTEKCRRISRPAVAGSDLDSDFDDEFDMDAVQVTNDTGTVRDIPDDDELEEPLRNAVKAVQRAMDDAIDLLSVSTSYDWQENFDTFRGTREDFCGPDPGPVKDYETPYDAFADIWSEDIRELIVQETNRYAKETIDEMKHENRLKRLPRLRQWVDTDEDEIMKLFAVFMLMGIDSRTSVYEYWMKDEILEMPKFRKIITFNRYVLLNKFLHFISNIDASRLLNSNQKEVLSAKLVKLAPVISHLNIKFSSLYNLSENISIDESLTLWKGRLSWAQTIRTKAARFGIKSYELCESLTGYMYKFEIYTGKNSEVRAGPALNADLGGKSTRTVLELLKGLEHLGHCVTMDNFYNCPALARYLKSIGFDCLGTLRSNRKNVPKELGKMPKNVAKGTIIARHCGDVTVLAWKDSKVVSMISTYHNSDTYLGSKAGKPLVKPVCVRDYNRSMGGVDLKNQKLSMYLMERKRGLKWYMKMFKRLLNVSILNAYVIFTKSRERCGMPVLTHREFRYVLAKRILEVHAPAQIVALPEVDSEETRLNRNVSHDPELLKGDKSRKRCEICIRNDKDKKVLGRCVTCDGRPTLLSNLLACMAQRPKSQTTECLGA